MAETQEKKKDAGYRAAVRGAKGVLRILIYILSCSVPDTQRSTVHSGLSGL